MKLFNDGRTIQHQLNRLLKSEPDIEDIAGEIDDVAVDINSYLCFMEDLLESVDFDKKADFEKSIEDIRKLL